jgi:putative transposase
MIEPAHDLAISKQAKALNISRGSVYYLPRPMPEAELALMRRLDRLHLEFPFAGSRMLRGLLAAEGCKIGRRHVKTLMKRMGIEALYRRPRTTKPEPAWRDNVFVERLWRSVKYEEVHLRAYESVSEARTSTGRYLDFYNGRRPHSSLDGITPDQAYFTPLPLRLAA